MRNVRDRCHRQSPFHHHYSPRVLSPSLRASRASGVCVSSRRTDLALYRETLKLADILNSLRYSCYGCRVRIRIRQSFRGVCHVRDDVILTSSIRICEMDVESTCRSGLGSPHVTYITYPIHNANIVVVRCDLWSDACVSRWPICRWLALESKRTHLFIDRGERYIVRKVFAARFSRCYLDR